MSLQAWITLAILIVMFLLLLRGKLPTWLVFMGTLAVMMTLRLAPEEELLKGFANSGVITVGVLFIVAAGMYSTGAITLIADKLIGLPKTLKEAQLKILPPVAGGSAFLNNTPLVAMMVPVVRDISRMAQIPGTYLYIPLSFASILGGAMTLIGTSTNLIIAGLVADQGMGTLNIFTPTLVGLPAAVVGIIFIMAVSKKMLPAPQESDEDEEAQRLFRAEFVIRRGSPLIGKTPREAGLVKSSGIKLISHESVQPLPPPEIEIEPEATENPPESEASATSLEDDKPSVKRIFQALVTPTKKSLGKRKKKAQKTAGDDPFSRVMQAGDILTFAANSEALSGLWITIGLKPRIAPLEMESDDFTHQLVEAVVAPGHPAVGRRISQLPVRETPPYVAKIVALSRNGEPPDKPLGDVEIQSGDVTILEVEDNFFYEARNQNEFLLTRRLKGYTIQRVERARIATIITVAMVLLAAFGVMSMLNAGLLAVGAMLLTGCIRMDAAWRSIEWKTLVILGAAIGMESAVTASGLSETIANALAIVGGDNPYVALTVVFLGAVLMTNVITNAAAAAFMFPIAVSMANQLGVNPMPFVVILMLGTSYAFINPAGYQTNLMVQGPGNYTFSDYAKIGLPLTAIVGAVAIALAPLVYGF